MSKESTLYTFFHGSKMTKDEFERVMSSFTEKTFKKNDFVLTEGQVASHFHIVENGILRAFVNDINGNDITTEFFSEGQILIDWPSFFLRIPTSENIQAFDDCNCWQIEFESFQQLFHSIEGFRESGRTRLVGSYFSLKKKSVSAITDTAQNRYLNFLKERPQIIQFVPLKHIASYLGITDTSLSRIRKQISSH